MTCEGKSPRREQPCIALPCMLSLCHASLPLTLLPFFAHQVTHDVSALTCADFLRAPGVQTPVIVRFSTVVHERGSPGEKGRQVRGGAKGLMDRKES